MNPKPPQTLLLILLVVALVFVGVGYYFWSTGSGSNRGLTSLLSQSNTSPNWSATPISTTDSSYSSPVTYQGTLPCADCEGLQTTLTLDPSPDGQPPDRIGSTYQMTETYLGSSVAPVQTEGYWILQNPLAYPTSKLDSSQMLLVLDHLDPDKRTIFWLKTQTSLVQLDAEGNEIDSSLNFTLTLQGANPNPAPIEKYVLPPADSSPPPGTVPTASPAYSLPPEGL